MHPLLITAVGLLAQAFFSARTLVQWILSEKARKVLSPTAFWVFSLCGSALLATYGWLRLDFAVVAGQLVSYFVYVWNLKIKGVKMPRIGWLMLIAFPVVALAFVSGSPSGFVSKLLIQTTIPRGLLVFGTIGQLLMTLRFVYQWFYSARLRRSELPPPFWWLSLSGASIVFIYGIFRQDIVLLLGQGFGIIVYARNIIIGHRTPSA